MERGGPGVGLRGEDRRAPPAPRDQAGRRRVRTGTALVRIVRSATLPSSMRETPPRPSVPMTIRIGADLLRQLRDLAVRHPLDEVGGDGDARVGEAAGAGLEVFLETVLQVRREGALSCERARRQGVDRLVEDVDQVDPRTEPCAELDRVGEGVVRSPGEVDRAEDASDGGHGCVSVTLSSLRCQCTCGGARETVAGRPRLR